MECLEMHDDNAEVDNEVEPEAEYDYEGEALEVLNMSVEPVQPEGERLYNGSNLSAVESSTLVQAFALKNSLTRAGTKELLNILQLLLPETAKVPTSQYLLHKSVNVDMSSVKKCLYCDSCQNQVVTEGDRCDHCKTRINEKELIKNGKYFLMFDIKQKLKSLLDIKEVSDELAKNLTSRHEKRQQPGYVSTAPRYYTDITDGDCYRKLPLETDDITCSINTDGVNVFKSSTFSVWPIFLSINELSYKTRRKHTLLVGLWFGKNKPSFRTFLKPFVDQCVDLSENGFEWHFNGEELTSRVFFVLISADSVARAPLQGLKQFNGQFGCPFCYNPGTHFKTSGKFRKWIYPPPNSAKRYSKRTQASWLDDLKKLKKKLNNPGKKQISVHGVLNPSPFIVMPEFDIVDGQAVDYMHTALLGVLKTYTLMLIDSKNHQEHYYLGPDAQRKINEALLRCKVPTEVNRTTRDLKDIAFWKANEWKSWYVFVYIFIVINIIA